MTKSTRISRADSHPIRSGSSSRASVFGPAEGAFRLLTAGPRPLALDGRFLDRNAPEGLVSLDVVRRQLIGAGYAVRARVWAELARRAQTGGSAWVVGAVGVAVPALRRLAGEFTRGFPGDVDDLEAEILAGFVSALRRVDPDGGRVFARLYWAAQRAGARLRFAEAAAAAWAPLNESVPPPAAAGHPDLILAQAVADGILTQREASVILANRLDGIPIVRIAELLDCSFEQARHLRDRAEYKLVRELTGTGTSRIEKRISASSSQKAA